MRRLLTILLLLSLFGFGQTELLPTVAWRTYVRNVEQLTDSTYKFEVMPLDWNQPGAATMQYGNYFQDYGGNKYEVIDSAYLSVTVKDIFEHGVSPQVDRIGLMFQSPFDSKYLATIPYQYLDETALDNARAIELAYLYNRIPRFATITEAIAGNDSTTIMSPRMNRDSDTLLYVPFYGAAENVYSDHNATFDTLKSQAMQGDTVRLVFVNNEGTLFDSLIHIGASDIVLNLAGILEAQAGINDSIMTALRTAEQLELNAVPYYNVREDIYSNFDATFDSIFASNLYQENISVDATGTAGVYDKEVLTNNIEVYLNGVLQRENVHYTQTETQISFIMTPLADDYVTIKYKQ